MSRVNQPRRVAASNPAPLLLQTAKFWDALYAKRNQTSLSYNELRQIQMAGMPETPREHLVE